MNNGQNAAWYCGVLVHVPRHRQYGFLSYDMLRRLDGQRLDLRTTGDLYLHITHNPALGVEMPRSGTRVQFRVREPTDSRTQGSIEVFDAEVMPKGPPSQDRYKGRIVRVGRGGEYGFIGIETMTRVGQETKPMPVDDDVIIHIKHNRALREPLPEGQWITFSLIPDFHPKSKRGLEAANAEEADYFQDV